MQRKTISSAIFFLIICLCLFLLGKTAIGNVLQNGIVGILSPLQQSVMHLFTAGKNKQDDFLKSIEKSVNQYQLEQENKALRDQFQTTTIPSQKLLPATIIGAPRFVPGISAPEYFVINKGLKDGIRIGQAVTIKDTLVGKIVGASDYVSKIALLTNTSSTFTAKTKTTGAIGVIRGMGNAEMILDKVVLSDTISKGDMVLTKGDINEQGIGYPANLVVGKIISVDKKSSALFQMARVSNLIDFSALSMVFVFTGYEN